LVVEKAGLTGAGFKYSGREHRKTTSPIPRDNWPHFQFNKLIVLKNEAFFVSKRRESK